MKSVFIKNRFDPKKFLVFDRITEFTKTKFLTEVFEIRFLLEINIFSFDRNQNGPRLNSVDRSTEYIDRTAPNMTSRRRFVSIPFISHKVA